MIRLRCSIPALPVWAALAALVSLDVSVVAAQEPTAPLRIRVFVDCNGEACDDDHLRREIAYVDWVRDRLDADVEILVTDEETGAGGERYEIAFAGRRTFVGMDEELRYTRTRRTRLLRRGTI